MRLILVILLPVVMGKTFTKYKVHFARRLTGHTMKTIVSVSVDECHKECRLRADCLSLNYNRDYSMCELNNYALTGNEYKEEKGWIYLNVEPATHTDLGLCNVNTCPSGIVCRNGNCVAERCEPTSSISVANGVVRGNMNDIGSRIRIACDARYNLIGNDTSECLVDGSWSSLPTCASVQCEPTSNISIANGFVLGDMNDIGSSIMIVCDPEYDLIGSGMSQCLAEGSWSSLPTCAKMCPEPMELQNTEGYPTIVSANIYTSHGLLTDPNLINVNIVVRENSSVVFDCSGGMFLQFHQKIFCHDGKWVYMPGCEEMGLGIDCAVDVSCSVQPQSNECVNRICRCPLGTSYSYSESRCIEKCPNGYADTFNEVKGVGQWGNNNLDVFKGITREMCEAECISTVSFICRSFDYKYTTSYCYLQSVTYFDDPPSVYEWSGGAYFLRDCL